MTRGSVVLLAIVSIPYAAHGQQTGGVPALREELALEQAARAAGDSASATALKNLATRLEALEVEVARLRGDLTGACWVDVQVHDLASTPPGSTLANGAYLGQGPASRYGRMCWVQDSDWNQLLVPAPEGDLFAIEAEVYIPGPTPSYESGAQFRVFTEQNGDHGMQVAIRRGAVDWWTLSLTPSGWNYQLVRSRPFTLPFDGWHRFRVEGIRSACTMRAVFDGAEIDTWRGGCDLAGSWFSLESGATIAYRSGAVGWSNMRVQQGSFCSSR